MMTWSSKLNAEDLSGLHDLARDRDVRVARLGHAGGMVVCEDHRRRGVFERRAKHFARMDDVRRERANGNDLVMDQLIVRIQI